MNGTFCRLSLAALMVVLAASPAWAAKEPADVEGAWQISWQGRQGERTMTARFEQDGTELRGTIGGRGGRGGGQLTGSVKGNKITFRIEMKTQRGEFTLVFRGKVEGDTMGGNLSMGQMTAKWTGTRAR